MYVHFVCLFCVLYFCGCSKLGAGKYVSLNRGIPQIIQGGPVYLPVYGICSEGIIIEGRS